MTNQTKGTFRCYVPRNFGPEALAGIARANAIVEEYESKGYSLTLRQLYYQHVARGFIENSGRSYDRLGGLISDARLAGLMSWTAIEDRTRNLTGLQTYSSPGQAVSGLLRDYRLDLWVDQPVRPEVWVEKEALIDVAARICNKLRVDFFACRGYVSQSEQWRAGRRFARRIREGQRPIVFHLGDHDPSGIDMTRDNQERLSLFAGVPIQVVRLALNMDQVERYSPPPNPAKVTDARFASYAARFGDESWELDALSPEVISNLINDAVLRVRDEKLWDAALGQETGDRQVLEEYADEMGEEPPEQEDV